MATATVTVTKLTGKAWIRDADGNQIELREGMRIPSNARVETAQGALVQLQADGQAPFMIGESQTVALSQDVLAEVTAQEAAVPAAVPTELESLVAAINQGQDPLADMDPTAATLDGGGGGGGTYVRLNSILESTSPLGLAYPRGSILPPEERPVSALDLQDDGEESATPAPVAETPAAPTAPTAPAAPAVPQPIPNVGGIVSATSTVQESGLLESDDNDTSHVVRGELQVNASDGVQSITIDGTTFTLAQLLDPNFIKQVQTQSGTLTILEYTPSGLGSSGTLVYEFVLDTTIDHGLQGDGEQFQLILPVAVTGSDGSIYGGGSITIVVLDDAPVAQDDNADLQNGVTIEGNVIEGRTLESGQVEGKDKLSADGTQIQSVRILWNGQDIVAERVTRDDGEDYFELQVPGIGVLQINGDGSFVFTRVEEGLIKEALNAQLTFNYVLVDGDGDVDDANLVIRIEDNVPSIVWDESDSGVKEIVAVVKESGLPSGSAPDPVSPAHLRMQPAADSEPAAPTSTISGEIQFASVDGVSGVFLGDPAVEIGTDPLAPTVIPNTGLQAYYVMNPDGKGGVIHYTFSLAAHTGAHEHKAPDADTNADRNIEELIRFPLKVVDSDNDTSVDGNLVIRVEDDVPTAIADVGKVEEGAQSVAGNVIAGAGDEQTGQDTLGADSGGVARIKFGDSEIALNQTEPKTDYESILPALAQGETRPFAEIAGQYGVLRIFADGDYVYVRYAVGSESELAIGNKEGALQDKFTYTLVDGDGDAAAADLTIDIVNGTPTLVLPENSIIQKLVDEAALNSGSKAASNKEFTKGSIDFTSADGVAYVEVGGQRVTPQISDGSNNWSPVWTSVGNGLSVMVLLTPDTSPVAGKIFYKFSLPKYLGDATNHESDDFSGPARAVRNIEELVKFEITVVDRDGDSSTTGTLKINIKDDVPVAQADTVHMKSGAETVSGNVIGGTLDEASLTEGSTVKPNGADTTGADGAKIYGVKFGNKEADWNPDKSQFEIQGDHGTLVVKLDGSYTYTRTGSGKDVFTYQLVDGDNDVSKPVKLTIHANDKAPIATDIFDYAIEGSTGIVTGKTNIILTVDISRSMFLHFNDKRTNTGADTPPDGNIYNSRLGKVIEALEELLGQSGVGSVYLQLFNGTNQNYPGKWYSNSELEQLITDLESVRVAQGTDYVNALNRLMDPNNGVKLIAPYVGPNDKTIALFMTDGLPSNNVGTETENKWVKWLQDNKITDSYAVGFGGLTNGSVLNPIAWPSTDGVEGNRLVIDNMIELRDALVSEIVIPPTTASATVVPEGTNFGDGWRTDGIKVHSIEYVENGQAKTFNFLTSGQSSVEINDARLGKVIFFANGNYEFRPNPATNVNAAEKIQITFKLVDKDGSVSNPAKLTLELRDSSEVRVRDDVNEAKISFTIANPSLGESQNKFVIDNYVKNFSGWVTSKNSQTGSAKINLVNGKPVIQLTDDNGHGSGTGKVVSALLDKSQVDGLTFNVTRTKGTSQDEFNALLWYKNSSGVWKSFTINPANGQYKVDFDNLPSDLKADINSAISFKISFEVEDNTNKPSSGKASFKIGGLPIYLWGKSEEAKGNLLENDAKGAEGASIHYVHADGRVLEVPTANGITLKGTYGDLKLMSDGSYTYTPKSGLENLKQTQYDVFDYVLKQADGDQATGHLTITLKASGVSVSAGTETLPNPHVTPVDSEGFDAVVHVGAANTSLLADEDANKDELFVWSADSLNGANTSFVLSAFDAQANGGDRLDLSDLLQGEEHSSDLSKFLHVTNDGDDTVIAISKSGQLQASGQGADGKITLKEVDLVGNEQDQNTLIQKLIEQGKITLDGH